MGRKQVEFKLKRKLSKPNFETRKKQHRCSDSKYRHSVQYLFELIKNQVPGPKTKDSTLTDALNKIKDIENEIFNQNGSVQPIDMHREEFFNLLSIEETIWRKEKDVIKWWHKMQEFLKPLHLPKKSDDSRVVSNVDVNDASSNTPCFSTSTDLNQSNERDLHEIGKPANKEALFSSYDQNGDFHKDVLAEKFCAKQDKVLENMWNSIFHKEENLSPFQASPAFLNGNVEYGDFNTNASTSTSEENSVTFSTEVAYSFLENESLTSFESSFQNLPSLGNTVETFSESRRNENKSEIGKDSAVSDVPSFESKQISLIGQPFFATELPLDSTVVQVQGLNLAEQNFLPASSVFYVL